VETLFARFTSTAVLFAQDAEKPAGDPMALLQNLMPFIAIFVLFYFLLIRPQRREQARRREMLESIKKNDRVITAGGIYGVVTNVQRDDDEVTVKVDEATNTKLRLTLSSIVRVIGDEPANETANK
jgi:preprotein translocase subunit YajC